MEPSPGFRERLLSRAAAEVPGASDPTPIQSRATAPLPFRPRRSASPMLLPLAAMLVVGLALGAISAQRWYGEQELVAVALEGSQVEGSARVVLRRSGTAELSLDGLPDPGPGRVYQAWVIPLGEEPRPSGTHASGEGVIGLTTPVLGNTVAITVEPAPGRPSPTGPPVLAAVVRA